jgi:hypothetical protein
MRMLSFAVAMAMVTAAHAQIIDRPPWDLSTVSGPNDVTALIVELPRLPHPRFYRWAQECKPPPEPGLFIREGRAYFYACNEEEARYYEELWVQHLRDLRHRLGDPGRH